MRPSASWIAAMIFGKNVDRIARGAAELARMQVPVGAAHDHLLIHHAAQGRRDGGRVLVPHAGVADERHVGLQLVLVGLDEFRQEFRTVLLGALDQERDVDRQRSGHRFPGPAGLHEGQHLALVVGGPPRADHLPAIGQGRHLGLEGRRLPQIERIDRLHVVMAVEQHMGLGLALRVPDHRRMPAGFAQGRVDAEALELIHQPLPGLAAIVLVGGIGGDRRDLEPAEKAFERGVEIGIDSGEDLVELGHGEKLCLMKSEADR